MAEKPTLIVITGPTASGKSALAIETALRLNTEIISADSRQIYRDIPIVTAQPSAEELAAVPHHLIGTLPLTSYYSASMFEQDALAIITDILQKRGIAIVCGGSMMYIDALCNGIDDLPTVPHAIRTGLKQKLDEKGEEWLIEELRNLDPEYFSKVDLKNLKRVFHAVEITLTAGRPYSSLLKGEKRERPFRILKYMVDMPRELLFERINNRVDAMLKVGLEAEARKVYPQRHLNSLNTVGLKEMFAMFDGTMERDTAIARIKKNTRVYAKKQLTWWARDKEIISLSPNSTLPGV